jgi:two-component system OmpR family response regulator
MHPLTVFLVEDSPTIRQNLVATLEELAPVRVVGAVDSAADAVQALTCDPPPCDLAIVDVFLRQGSGLDVLQALQRRPNGPKRVVLTNFATAAMRAHCLALGADQVFDKSGEVEALVSYCESLADSDR